MVKGLWDNSLTSAFLRVLSAFYANSLFRTVLISIATAIKSSRTAYILNRALTAKPVTQTRYAAFLGSLGALLRRVWSYAESGVIAAVLGVVARGINRVAQNSVILSALLRFGARRMLLLAFALYMPLDVFLRSAGLPPLISSLWDEALLAAMLLYALYDTAKSLSKPRITPVDSPFLLFLSAGIFLMLFVSPDMSIGLDGFRAVFQYMLFFPALVRLVKNEGDFNLLSLTILGTGVVLAFHGIYQYIAAVPIPAGWVSMSEEGVRTRAFSIVGSPNILGDFMVMTAPIAAAMAYRVKKLKTKMFFWGCFGVICLCCVFTFSRGAWIGLAVAAVIFALAVDRRLFALMLVAVVAALLVPDVANRLVFLFTPEFQLSNESGGRAMRWAYGFDLLKRNGVTFGVGLGRFGGAVAMQNQVMPYVQYFYLDNYYIKTLVEMGVVGIVSYVLLLISSVWTGIRSIVLRAGGRVQAVALLAAVCGVLAHCFFENIFEVPYMNAYFWCFIALLASRGFVWESEEKG